MEGKLLSPNEPPKSRITSRSTSWLVTCALEGHVAKRARRQQRLHGDARAGKYRGERELTCRSQPQPGHTSSRTAELDVERAILRRCASPVSRVARRASHTSHITHRTTHVHTSPCASTQPQWQRAGLVDHMRSPPASLPTLPARPPSPPSLLALPWRAFPLRRQSRRGAPFSQRPSHAVAWRVRSACGQLCTLLGVTYQNLSAVIGHHHSY